MYTKPVCATPTWPGPPWSPWDWPWGWQAGRPVAALVPCVLVNDIQRAAGRRGAQTVCDATRAVQEALDRPPGDRPHRQGTRGRKSPRWRLLFEWRLFPSRFIRRSQPARGQNLVGRQHVVNRSQNEVSHEAPRPPRTPVPPAPATIAKSTRARLMTGARTLVSSTTLSSQSRCPMRLRTSRPPPWLRPPAATRCAAPPTADRPSRPESSSRRAFRRSPGPIAGYVAAFAARPDRAEPAGPRVRNRDLPDRSPKCERRRSSPGFVDLGSDELRRTCLDSVG